MLWCSHLLQPHITPPFAASCASLLDANANIALGSQGPIVREEYNVQLCVFALDFQATCRTAGAEEGCQGGQTEGFPSAQLWAALLGDVQGRAARVGQRGKHPPANQLASLKYVSEEMVHHKRSIATGSGCLVHTCARREGTNCKREIVLHMHACASGTEQVLKQGSISAGMF